MFKIIESVFGYLFTGHDDDPIRRYCQTEFKDNWKEKYYSLTGKSIQDNWRV
jgi:hypothetical protein|tara:strand:- start:899 stop:1054 length:156 start_codon:yes stop_codon:yes gene_type:complete